jgi:glucose-1-phosphate thymidylyltransferase
VDDKIMKGIIMAGGNGSRLYPMTKSVNKHLLPIYDKPMIYYPLSVLMLMDIKEIAIITNDSDINDFNNLLSDGSHLGINIDYLTQEEPNGIAEAFIISKNFIGNEQVCLILGDNIFYGNGISHILNKQKKNLNGACIFAYPVFDPERYGIINFNDKEEPVSINEKPENPKSNLAITGLYFYNNDVINIANNNIKSNRGELEISSINQKYLENKRLNVEIMGRGLTWFDAGTPKSLMESSQFVQSIENRQGFKIACIEEIAYRKNWISKEQLIKTISKLGDTSYSDYLNKILKI